MTRSSFSKKRALFMPGGNAGLLLAWLMPLACSKADPTETPAVSNKVLMPLQVGNRWDYRCVVRETAIGDPLRSESRSMQLSGWIRVDGLNCGRFGDGSVALNTPSRLIPADHEKGIV